MSTMYIPWPWRRFQVNHTGVFQAVSLCPINEGHCFLHKKKLYLEQKLWCNSINLFQIDEETSVRTFKNYKTRWTLKILQFHFLLTNPMILGLLGDFGSNGFTSVILDEFVWSVQISLNYCYLDFIIYETSKASTVVLS